jgi:hypothetical protein
MSQNKYIFNILDFFFEKKQKILKNDCHAWYANQKPFTTMLWPLDQQEWDKK